MAQDVLGNTQHVRGSVVRIKLTNFLTYDSVEVKPAPRLNLLLGPNGTGKSTFVCALCLGLAGSPTILGRSTKFQDYVKHEKDEATIEVELCSGGDRKNPIIKTVIRRTGNGGREKEKEYWVDGYKKTQQEVRDFVKTYHIQVDNLCQFLAQDKVVDFARQSKQDLLLNTEKAAGTVDLFDQHMKLKDRYAEGSDHRAELKDIVAKRELLQKKLAILEKPFKQFEEYESRREKLLVMEKKRPWIEYEQLREEVETLKSELKIAEQDYAKREKHMQPLRTEISKTKEQMRQLDGEFLGQKRLIAQAKARIGSELESVRRVSTTMDGIKSALNDVRGNFETKTNHIRTVENTVAELYRKLEDLQDDDVSAQLQSKDREMFDVNRQLDELESRQNEATDELNRELEKRGRVTYELSSLENRQQQALQHLRRNDGQAYNAYMWYLNNKGRFRGSVWLPFLDMRISDKANAKYVEAFISRRDLFSFIFESFDDMQVFLGETTKENIRVAAGEVPAGDASTRYNLPDDLKRLGFRDLVCNMFEAPNGVKKYFVVLNKLNEVPIGTEAMEQDLERYVNAVKGRRFTRFATPNKKLTMSESRYGGSSTLMNQPLGEPQLLGGTTGLGDETREENLRKQQAESEKEIRRLQTLVTEIVEKIREVKRRYEVLQQEKSKLKYRAGERASLKRLIEHKEKGLDQMKLELPDVETEENNCKEQLKAKFEEKMALFQRAVDFTKTIEDRCRARAMLTLRRAQISMAAQTLQKQLEEAILQLRGERNKLEALQKDYAEKKNNLRMLSVEVGRDLGLGPNQQLSEELQKAFEELPDDLETLDEQIEEEKAKLEHTQGVDKTIAIDYKNQQTDLNRTVAKETKKNLELTNWETEVGNQRQKWLTDLQTLIETISRNFSRFMRIMECAGEVELEAPEEINDFTKYGVKIKVKFRDDQPLLELGPNHQSGGERSVSTMLYMLALQELSHVPFRCVDEINQGMDPINERKVFEMMTKLLSGTSGALNCTQYFMLTPKLLRGLPIGDVTEVWLIHNGPKMLPNEKWSAKQFLKRKRALARYL